MCVNVADSTVAVQDRMPTKNNPIHPGKSLTPSLFTCCRGLVKQSAGETRKTERQPENREMKALCIAEFLTTPRFVKITAFAIIFFTFFYVARFWFESDSYHPLSFFFTSRQSPPSTSPSPSPSIVDLSTNSNATLSDTSSSLVPNRTTDVSAISVPTLPPAAPPPPPPVVAVAVVATPPPPPDRFGIVDENGAMRDDFIVGEFDPDLPETLEKAGERVDSGGRVKVKKFRPCPLSMKEFIPCLDNMEEIRKLKSTERGEKFERHCPGKGKSLNCLVPAPKGYKAPIPWPKSRDQLTYTFQRCHRYGTVTYLIPV
ncbi:hypothetical protein ACLOJK_030102 [Asimina triloba]